MKSLFNDVYDSNSLSPFCYSLIHQICNIIKATPKKILVYINELRSKLNLQIISFTSTHIASVSKYLYNTLHHFIGINSSTSDLKYDTFKLIKRLVSICIENLNNSKIVACSNDYVLFNDKVCSLKPQSFLTAFAALPLQPSLIDTIISSCVDNSFRNLSPDLIKLLTLSNWFFIEILDGRNCKNNLVNSWLNFDSNFEEASRILSSKFSDNLILLIDEKVLAKESHQDRLNIRKLDVDISFLLKSFENSSVLYDLEVFLSHDYETCWSDREEILWSLTALFYYLAYSRLIRTTGLKVAEWENCATSTSKKLQLSILYSHILQLPIQSDLISACSNMLLANNFGIPCSSMFADPHFDITTIYTVNDLALFHSSIHSKSSLYTILLHESSISWILRLLFESNQFELLLNSTAWFHFYILLCSEYTNKLTFEYILTVSLISSSSAPHIEFLYWPSDNLYNISLRYSLRDSEKADMIFLETVDYCSHLLATQNVLNWIPSSNICKQIEENSSKKIKRSINFKLHLIELATLHNSFLITINLSSQITSGSIEDTFDLIKIDATGDTIDSNYHKLMDSCWILYLQASNSLSNYDLSFIALSSIYSPELRINCLRSFLNVCAKDDKTPSLWRKILSFPWSIQNGLNQELIDLILKKAQNCSIEDLVNSQYQNYYFILYSFFVQRSDFQNAAKYIYHYSTRLEIELQMTPNVVYLKEFNRSLQLVLQCLKSVSNPTSCWILWDKPCLILNESTLEPVGYSNLYEKDFVTIQKVSSKINFFSSILNLVEDNILNINAYSFFNSESVIIVFDKLLSTGLFSHAIEFCVHQDLDMSTLFKVLTRRCISIQQCITKSNLYESVNSIYFSLDNNISFQDLVYNLSRISCKEGEIYSSEGVLAASRKCWDFLKDLLSKYDNLKSSANVLNLYGNGQYKICVAETMLILSFELPIWLFSIFLKEDETYDFAIFKLLKLMLQFDYIEKVLLLSAEIIKAANSKNHSRDIYIPIDFFNDLFLRLDTALPKLDSKNHKIVKGQMDNLVSGLSLLSSTYHQ